MDINIYCLDIWIIISIYLDPINAIRLRQVSRGFYDIFNTESIINNKIKFRSAIPTYYDIIAKKYYYEPIKKEEYYNPKNIKKYYEIAKCFNIKFKYNIGDHKCSIYIPELESFKNNITSISLFLYNDTFNKILKSDQKKAKLLEEISPTLVKIKTNIDVKYINNLCNLRTLKYEYIKNDDFYVPDNVITLKLNMSNNITNIPYLPNLQILELTNLDNVITIPPLDNLTSLTVKNCKNFSYLPVLKNLKKLHIENKIPLDLSLLKTDAPKLEYIEICNYNKIIDHIYHIPNIKIDSLSIIWPVKHTIKNRHMLAQTKVIVLTRIKTPIDCAILNPYTIVLDKCAELLNFKSLKRIDDVTIVCRANRRVYCDGYEYSDAEIFNGFKKLTLKEFKAINNWQNLRSAGQLQIIECDVPDTIWPVDNISKLSFIECKSLKNIYAPAGIQELCIYNCNVKKFLEINLETFKFSFEPSRNNLDWTKLTYVDTLYLSTKNISQDTCQDIQQDLRYVFSRIKHVILFNMNFETTIGDITIPEILKKYKNVYALNDKKKLYEI